MASQKLVHSVLRCAGNGPARLIALAPRVAFAQTQAQLRSSRHTQQPFHTSRAVRADTPPVSKPADAITTPKPQPLPDHDTEPNRHAAFLGEADSDDGFEAFKDAHGDPPPSLDASNSAFHGEADSDDGFESQKDIYGQKLEAVDAQHSAFLGEADSDDGFIAHRDAHPEEGDHKIENPEESGLHGQPGEQDR